MPLIKKYRYEFILALVIALIALVSYLVRDRFTIFADVAVFREYVAGFGALGPLVVLGLTALEVVIAPLPGGVPAVASGVLFGYAGIIYAVVGNIIGSAIAFFIARSLGRKAVHRFIDGKSLSRFERMVYKRQKLIWALYFLPLMPLDVITFAIGLSSIRYGKFFIISSIGLTVSMSVYVILGDYFATLFF